MIVRDKLLILLPTPLLLHFVGVKQNFGLSVMRHKSSPAHRVLGVTPRSKQAHPPTHIDLVHQQEFVQLRRECPVQLAGQIVRFPWVDRRAQG